MAKIQKNVPTWTELTECGGGTWKAFKSISKIAIFVPGKLNLLMRDFISFKGNDNFFPSPAPAVGGATGGGGVCLEEVCLGNGGGNGGGFAWPPGKQMK